MTLRVYLPATVPLLAAWLADGIATAVGPAYAVTPELRELHPDDDIEELEYVASQAAADAALALLAADPDAPRRRVVLAVDVDEAALRPGDGDSAAVTLVRPVARSRWASALIGDADADELGWYGVQELDDWIAGTRQ